MRYLKIEEVGRILREAYKASRRDHLMLLLSFQHGLRASEVANLSVGDVSEGRIRVSRAKGSSDTQHALIASHNVLFDEPQALAAWLEERTGKTDALFPSRKGGDAMLARCVGRMAKVYMSAAGVDADLAHHHSLKHACCSIQARNGVKIEYIAQFVGHKDIKNTRIYLNITDDEATDKASAAFQSALGES